MSKKWRVFIDEEGGMSEASARSAKQLGAAIDTPEKAERLAATAWAESSTAGDQFEFCNGVAIDVTGGSVS